MTSEISEVSSTSVSYFAVRCSNVGFRPFWKRKSRTAAQEPKVAVETVELIKQMALENRLWGAERIRGELLKLEIRVSKRTIQKYMTQARRPKPSERKSNQNWSIFLHNHVSQVWACAFLPEVAELRTRVGIATLHRVSSWRSNYRNKEYQ